jgi:hypothetical protein
VESTAIRIYTLCFKVVLFEMCRFPGPTIEDRLSGKFREGRKGTNDVNISTVRSVSGFAVEVLKFGPLWTVNHWPFLQESQKRSKKRELKVPNFWMASFRFLRSARLFSPVDRVPVDSISQSSF